MKWCLNCPFRGTPSRGGQVMYVCKGEKILAIGRTSDESLKHIQSLLAQRSQWLTYRKSLNIILNKILTSYLPM